MSIRRLVGNFVFVIMLVGCSVHSSEMMPSIGVPATALNDELRIFVEEVPLDLRINGAIALGIDVTGDESIIFPPDFGVRIFRYVDGQWVDVQQVPIEYGRSNIILAPSQGNSLMMGSAIVYPILPEGDHSVLLRIFVVGRIYRDGKASDEKVGAYTDIVLKP